VIKIIMLSLGIWLFEGAALWSVVRSVDIGLTPTEGLVLLGAASLSTLVPTAPGFLGSYQFVFAITFAAFGLSQQPGSLQHRLRRCFCLAQPRSRGSPST
jgi:glycosyltransferase 2 family protein